MQMMGYFGRLQTVVKMKAVNVGSGLRQSLQTVLNMSHGIAGKDGRLGAIVIGQDGKGMAFVGPLIGSTAIMVNKKMMSHRIDEAAQRSLADEPTVVREQAEEKILHHVFSQDGIIST